MSLIPSIETTYQGCRFRSRLEARYAVFFDALQIPWEYEKEGFCLQGINYLPDFWLPQQQCWLEVKGTPEAVQQQSPLYQQFSGAVGPLVVFTALDPSIPGTKFTLDDHDSNGGFTCDNVGWYWCPTFGVQLSLRCSYRCTVFTHGYDDIVTACSDCDLSIHDDHHPLLLSAYTVARSARFEHGEHP